MNRGIFSPYLGGARIVCVVALALACLTAAPVFGQTGGDCVPDDETLCLFDARFLVRVDWQNFEPNFLRLPSDPDAGQGRAVPTPSSQPSTDTGYFWFFDPDDVGVVVKVLDGRQINGSFWVFASGLTNVEYTVRVTDTETDREAAYRNEPGSVGVVFDADAFDAPSSSDVQSVATAPAAVWSPLATGAPPRARVLPSHALPSCLSPDVACVQDGRVAIQVSAPSTPGGEPDIDAAPLVETGTTALFALFPGNGPEVGVKVVDGRSVNGELWTFVSGVSFQGMEVTVTDLVTHESVTYVQESMEALAIGDNQPFASDPPSGEWLETAEIPGFRFQVRVTAGGTEVPTRQESDCVPETLCVSGAVAGRSELFLRIVGPKPNGFLQPNLVKFSTSQLEVWIEQSATGQMNYYVLSAPGPASSDLTGFFDRRGFAPAE